MKKLLLSVTFFVAQLTLAQDLYHSVLNLPENLKTNAYAVVRLNDIQVNLDNPYKMSIQKHRIITVLNKYGNTYAKINVPYDNHSSVKSIKAIVYNAFGMEIKKVKSKDIKDYSNSGGNMYSDDRVKSYRYIPISYPYTIDYTTVLESENTAFYPRWYPILGYYASTQESHFSINYPANDLKLNVKENNFSGYNIINNSKSGHIDYSTKSLPAIEAESFGPEFESFAPNIVLAPNKFNLSGIHGTANNWKELGEFIYSHLLFGRDNLTPQTKSEIQSLVKGVDDPIARARKVYAYMQNKTRYISVQIGIGGWKPMPAEEVDKMKYGDCKALVNYTQALLKEANVNAYYTIVHADEKINIDKDVVAMQGNHVILFLPTKKDTVWLECTTQKNPFGYVGDFTNDRDVFKIDPKAGSTIIHTKVYKNTDNYQYTNGSYKIDDKGFIKGQVNIESAGTQFEYHFAYADEKRGDMIKHYKKYFDNINNLTVVDFKNKTDTLTNKFYEQVKLEASNYARKSGDRLLLTLNAFNKSSYVPGRIVERVQPLVIKNGFMDKDSVKISLPNGYRIEALPGPINIKSKFGVYKVQVTKLNDSTLIYKRKYLLKQGNYPKEDYKKFRDFKKTIVHKDNSKAILIKKS